MSINISVIICCFNSVTRIEPTLDHIAKQKLNDLKCELILVDNNCSDGTVKLVELLWKNHGNPFPLIIVKEKDPGLSFARKTGIFSSNGDVIIFCDDDNWLNSDYCIKCFNILKDFPDIGVLGGKSEAVSKIDFPFWFSTYQRYYAVGVQGVISNYVDDRSYLWGAGMAVRALEIKKMYNSGFRSILTGRKGLSLSSGEDTEICKWFLLVGKRLYYSDELVLKHYIDCNRLELSYLIRLEKAINEASEIIYFYNIYIFLKNNRKFKNLVFLIKPCVKILIGKANIQDRIHLQLYGITFLKFDTKIFNLELSIKKFHLS